jgi:hypothetical protein
VDLLQNVLRAALQAGVKLQTSSALFAVDVSIVKDLSAGLNNIYLTLLCANPPVIGVRTIFGHIQLLVNIVVMSVIVVYACIEGGI